MRRKLLHILSHDKRHAEGGAAGAAAPAPAAPGGAAEPGGDSSCNSGSGRPLMQPEDAALAEMGKLLPLLCVAWVAWRQRCCCGWASQRRAPGSGRWQAAPRPVSRSRRPSALCMHHHPLKLTRKLWGRECIMQMRKIKAKPEP